MSTVSTDPIADMLARIRNAIAVNKTELHLPHSKIKESVARLLKDYKYLVDVRTTDLKVGKTLTLVLREEDDNSKITEIKRLSKPGRRMYVSSKEIPLVKQGRGVVIVSTSQGVMSGRDARAKHIGGELICQVY